MTAPNKQALREAAERAASDSWGYDRDEFNDAITPEVVLALLDELEAAEKRVAELESLAAGMEQDPVAYTCSDALDDVYCGSAAMMGPVGAVGEVPLYTAPQLPHPAVVPSNELLSAIEEVLRISDRDHEVWHRARKGIADFRAAMLQGAEPVSQPYTLPANSFTDEELEGMSHGDNPQANAYRELLARRLNSPATPDGWVMVPMKLTAENGAKAALIGEFNLEYTLTCHECFGEGCDDCSGEGAWINTIPIDWTTIKEIWAKGVEHFSVAPQEAKGE